MSKLLINEHPLQVLPSLAKAIGLNEAIFLQQLHYWLTPRADYKPHYREWQGELLPWIYNTYDAKETQDGKITGWKANFPFWSVRTTMRIVEKLRNKGLIITTDKFNRAVTDRTLWYTIDYNALDEIENDILALSTMTDCHTQEDDNLADSRDRQDGSLLPETPEDTQETTGHIDFDSLQPASENDTLPTANDNHQQIVDQANGGGDCDPNEEVAKHYYWGLMGGPIPLPTKKRERKKWYETGKTILNRLPQPWDLPRILEIIDQLWKTEWDPFYQRMPCKDEAVDIFVSKIIKELGQSQHWLTPTSDEDITTRQPDELKIWWKDQLLALTDQFASLRNSELLTRDNGALRVLVTTPGPQVIPHLERSVDTILKSLDGVQSIEFVRDQ